MLISSTWTSSSCALYRTRMFELPELDPAPGSDFLFLSEKKIHTNTMKAHSQFFRSDQNAEWSWWRFIVSKIWIVMTTIKQLLKKKYKHIFAGLNISVFKSLRWDWKLGLQAGSAWLALKNLPTLNSILRLPPFLAISLCFYISAMVHCYEGYVGQRDFELRYLTMKICMRFQTVLP